MYTWTQDEDTILLGLKSNGSTWKQISEALDIPVTTCRERYHKLVAKETDWTEELDMKLERAYVICREEMWKRIARIVDGAGGVNWRAVEDRVWELGKRRFVKKWE